MYFAIFYKSFTILTKFKKLSALQNFIYRIKQTLPHKISFQQGPQHSEAVGGQILLKCSIVRQS